MILTKIFFVILVYFVVTCFCPEKILFVYLLFLIIVYTVLGGCARVCVICG
jgi:hypothetical protein